MKQTNISVFIPHYGCTHICSFCNQKTISGHSEPVTEKELESILEGQLENLKDSGTKAQIAFFGGSFTAIDRDYMIRLLTVAKRYTDAYPEQYDGIRCSTRPDCIDEEILGILKSYGMTAIELGAQSMNDEVLTANRRGHTAQDVRRASRLIKQSGFELGLQMMTGLPGDTDEKSLYTADEIIKLKPDIVRIYPTLTIKDTFLEKMYLTGKYQPQSVDEAVNLAKQLLLKFEKNNIKIRKVVIKVIKEIVKDIVFLEQKSERWKQTYTMQTVWS